MEGITHYHLVLVEHIHLWEEDGWSLCNNRVHVALGGWPSVYMKREEAQNIPFTAP